MPGKRGLIGLPQCLKTVKVCFLVNFLECAGIGTTNRALVSVEIQTQPSKKGKRHVRRCRRVRLHHQPAPLHCAPDGRAVRPRAHVPCSPHGSQDRKSTRLNSSHLVISYAVFCLKKKKTRSRCRIDGRYASLLVVRTRATTRL